MDPVAGRRFLTAILSGNTDEEQQEAPIFLPKRRAIISGVIARKEVVGAELVVL